MADFLIKAGADIELGASTPLMEAAQEGHQELVRYLLESAADVHAQTQTGDTALTYACENGHTDVADLLLQFGANLVCYCSIDKSYVQEYLRANSYIDSRIHVRIFVSFSRSTNRKGAEHR